MAETVRAKALRTLTNSDKRHPPYGLFWCEHERSDIEVMQCGLCEVTPSDRPCKWAMNLMEHLKATHPVSVKPVLTAPQFPAAGPFPDEKGVLVRHAHETWRKFELNGHMVEEFVSTDRPIGKFSDNMGADMKAVDDARVAAGNLPTARCSVQNGIRTYEDPALQEIEKTLGPFYCWNDKCPTKGQPCTHLHKPPCSYGEGMPCEFSAVLDPATPGLDGPEAAEPKKPTKAKKQPKLTSAAYNQNSLPGSNADICSHCDCETCGLNQEHLNYTDKTWKYCPSCGCDQCLGKPELQPTTLCGRKAALTAEVMGNTESCLPREELQVDTVQRYVRPAECQEGSCTACQCQTCGYRNLNCALNGDEPVLICSTCWLNHPHHWKVYAAIVKKCPHWRDAATFPADILAPGMGPCPETACQLMYNGEGGPCLCHSCKYGPGSCDTSCNVPGYPMETGQFACEWYAPKVATIEVVTQPAADLDVPDLVKVGDLVVTLHVRSFTGSIRKVTRVEKDLDGWQINGDLWDDFRHPRCKLTSKDKPIIEWGVAGWRAEGGKVGVSPEGDNAVEKNRYDNVYGEKFADDRVIVLTEEQVEQLCATEEAENATAPTWFTHVWLKPAGSKGHKDAQGYLEDPRNKWPHLGHARFVDTSTAKYLPGHRAESYGDEPECEHCLCNACLHQKDCRLDNTLNPCSRCKAKGSRHQKAVDCEGFRNS
jgi:hypothetical protein